MPAVRTDLRPLLQPIVDQVARLLEVTDAGVYLYDAERGVLEVFVDYSDVRPDETIVGSELALGEGLAGRAVASRETVTTSDYHATENRPDIYRDMPWGRAMSIPLIVDDEVLGALSVADTSKERAFTENEKRLLDVFVEQASVTLSHAQKLMQERRWSESLRQLNEISQRWRQPETDLETLLTKIVNATSELLQSTYAVLYLYDPDRRKLTLAASNRSITDERVELDLDEGLTGQVAKLRQPQSAQDYGSWSRRTEKWSGIGIQAVLGVPLLSGDHLLGVLDVAHTEEGQSFSDEDVQLLRLLADQAALSIEQAQRRALHRRFRSIGEQMLDTRHQADLGPILENVAQALEEYSPFKAVAISVFNRPLPMDHAGSPTIQGMYIAGVSSEKEAELRHYANEGQIVPNVRIRDYGHRIGDGYYVTPDHLPGIEHMSVSIDSDSEGHETRPQWGDYDNFVYFLRLSDRVIGRISLSDPVNGLIPTADELEPVESFVSFAAVAIQRARYQERMETLYRISRDLGSIESLDTLYSQTLELLQDLFPFDYAAMLRADTDSRQLHLVAQHGRVHCPYRVGDPIPFEKGITGWVAEHRRAELIHDVSQDERFIQGDVSMGAELTVPIEFGSTLFGVLNLESTHTRAFSDEDCHLLEALSDQIAVAISNLQRRERLEDFQARLQGVYSLMERLTRIEDLDDLCEQGVDLIQANFPYDYVVLLTLEGDRLVQRGFGSKLPEAELLVENFRRLALDQGLTGWSARHKESALVNDVAASKHYIPGHPDIRSELAMPIVESGQVLGVLNIESTHKDAFSQDDEELLEALARQIGVAMRSIERRTRVEELNDFLRELNETEGINALLERVLKRVVSLLEPKAEGGSVMFYDDANDQFVFRTAVGRDFEQLRHIAYRPSELDELLNAERPTFLTASHQRDHPATERLQDQGVTLPASTISLPIRERETRQVIAILHVNNFHEEGIFDESDADVLLQVREEITAALLRARDREQLRELATRDALTGAYNRHYLNEFLQRERERSERYAHPLSLVMVDINGFYEVNDRYGHAEGDRILRELAQLLIHNVRLPDRVVRYGGDEFVIVMPETLEDDAREAMARVEQLVDDWDPGLDGVAIDFSFGIASWRPDTPKRPEELLNEADAFMYRRRTMPDRRRARKREISECQSDNPDESTGGSSS